MKLIMLRFAAELCKSFGLCREKEGNRTTLGQGSQSRFCAPYAAWVVKKPDAEARKHCDDDFTI